LGQNCPKAKGHGAKKEVCFALRILVFIFILFLFLNLLFSHGST
jgi:hypothetical protein